MIPGHAGPINPRTRTLQEGILTVKKPLTLLAAALGIALSSMNLVAQQSASPPAEHPATRFSTYPPAERIVNLDTLIS